MLMKRCALLVALLIVAGSPAQANPVALSGTQLLRLERGEIIVLDLLPPGGSLGRGQGGTALTLVNAPADTVWRVLVDYPHHSGLYPRVTPDSRPARDGLEFLRGSGSPGRTRTCDILINSQALYRLSYRGIPLPTERKRLYRS